MTSANVLQTQAGPGQILNANANAVKGNGIAGGKTAASFSSFFQGTGLPTATSGSLNDGKSLSVQETVQSSSYAKREIAPAETKTAAEKLTQTKDTVADTREALLNTVAEKLDVDESELEDAMAALGMTAFDLLDPQNLAQLYMQVSGETSQTELLVDSRFVDLMQSVSEIGNDLMESLGVTADEMDEVVAQLDLLEQPAKAGISPEESTVSLVETEITDVDMQATQSVEPQVVQSPVNAGEPEGEKETMEPGMKEEVSSPAVALRSGQTQDSSSESSEHPGTGSGDRTQTQVQRDGAQGIQTELTGNMQNVTSFSENLEALLLDENSVSEKSFSSLNPLDLIQQIAQNVKVSLSQESSSMEMQLNPENLGKIYLQVSAREGSVHATIAAQNEAVKTALEAQVAELKESLSQSGVKVDAVEVTVASHEFERNLEQGEKRQQEEGERQQEQISHRRNLDLSMVQEMAGELSEEEALAAQIMQDNGNSVDLTA